MSAALVEVVCECGFRDRPPSRAFEIHMSKHARTAGETGYSWWTETDGVADDRISGAERRRRATK